MNHRRSFQVVLGLLSLITLLASLSTIVLGSERFLDTANAGIDNQIRYMAGVYLGVFLLMWWCIPRIETVATHITFIASAVFIGGVARTVSILDVGASQPIQYPFIALELSAPLLLWWYRAKVSESGRTLASADRDA